MPKVRHHNVPLALVQHLVDRMRDREVAHDQLELLSEWLKREPEVSAGKWFKRFPGMIVCGEGELVKTFLRIGQAPDGQEMP